MHTFGGSVVVALVADILKIHVHTDTPEAVFTYAARWGRVETTKADDMRAQHRPLAHPERRPVAIVTDTSADLADAVLDRHHIALVPLQVIFGDETFRDRVELKPEEFYRRLRAAKELPTTSQPTPGEFVRVFRDARERGRRGGGRAARRERCRARSSLGAGGGAGGRHLRGAPGGQPVRLARAGDAGAARRRSWPSRGGRRRRSREELRAGARAVGDAPDGGHVRQPAPVGPGLPGQGVAGRDARREADPLARRRRPGRAGGPGAGPGAAWCPGCWPCWSGG